MSALSKDLQQSIANAIERTKNNTGTTFIVALNYGGRNEITNAVKKIALKVKNNKLKIEDITENTITEKHEIFRNKVGLERYDYFAIIFRCY